MVLCVRAMAGKDWFSSWPPALVAAHEMSWPPVVIGGLANPWRDSIPCKAVFRVPTKTAERPMNMNVIKASSIVLILFTKLNGLDINARAESAPRTVLPDAVVDLRTSQGAARLNAQWRYSDTQILEIAHRDVGPDLKATGRPNHTFDFIPDARARDLDDSRWEIIRPESLEERRGHGRLSFNWYRINVTIPERVGSLQTKGSTAVFEIVVDDYAEVWVNGKLGNVLGQQGGSVVAGWNAPNRVILSRDAQPDQKFEIAVLGINGPLSVHSDTYIWVRSATVDFYRPGRLSRAREAKLMVEKVDPALETILPTDAKLEKLADGFAFTEGPIWIDAGNPAIAPDSTEGFLLFSDPNDNLIYRCSIEGEVQVYKTKSGYSGEDIGEYGQPGSNGLTVDSQGRLTICQQGNRRVVRIEKNGVTTVLAERYEGKRLNSPNDLVYRSDGTLFFTDPPFGLLKFHKDPRRETPFSGVYSVQDGKVQIVSTDFTGPNGLAFSPDEKLLYVGDWDDNRKVINRYPVNADGTLGKGELFFNMTGAAGEDAIDGIKVDQRGNLYVSGPGGLWILSAEGKHLGTLHCPEHPHDLAWGDSDRRTLYLAAQTSIYRLRLNIPGTGLRFPTSVAKND
jgi:gluconolactonase